MRAFTLVIGVMVGLAGFGSAAHARPDEPPRTEIVGGALAGGSEFPFVVRLNNGCAGTLISSRYVLTAAHCASRTGATSSYVVTMGSPDLGSAKALEVRSERVRRAPGFTDVTRGDDWALIRLAHTVDLPVVALPTGTGLDGGALTVIGWGALREGALTQQRHLRKVQVPYVGDGTCGNLFRSKGYPFVASDMICAGDLRNGGRDACQGDSGGPLLRRDGARWVQVGIVSWGVGCGRAAYPGVYTQVSRFAADIRAAIEEQPARD
ncbi:S1 family peptidase [Catellatospora tritici]|uniref:S1 family peptidase n=1 Tax=Catellatospora tritici TaxID=2851566 RepID=UPI001C2DBBA8|nr:serine protease [Catellatospora tritici]MBV1849090.1 serine protease [Catellatospora tritici]